jgi:hypothetical protein
MKWSRGYSVLGLALVLAIGVGCTDTVSAPTEVPVSGSIVIDSVSGTVPLYAQLLYCEAQPDVVAEKTIGPEGGTLKIGTHSLDIPRGALTSTVRITGEQVSGSVNSVRLSPEGLQFAKPARLSLSYRNCASLSLLKRVAYTSELLKILEVPPSKDYPKNQSVIGEIDHFSRYAVAY